MWPVLLIPSSDYKRQINLIERFCKSVGMSLNLSKTKIIVFRNGGIVKEIEKWFYQGMGIEIVPLYKYLGVYFTPKLKWTRTKELLACQAKKAATSIFRYQKSFGHFTPIDAFKLFDTMVKPIACYGAEIWGYKYSDEIERVQTSFCKQYIGLKTNTMDSFVLGECGRYCMAVSYMTQCIKYWLRLIQMPTHRYPHQCYKMLRSLDEAGRTTWASHVRTLLFTHGFGYVWVANTVGDANRFISIFLQRMKDISIQNWRSRLNESSKAEHYNQFKSLLEVEKYLFLDLSYLGRKTIAKFRCSSHNLMIEKGRHLHIDREYRFCPFCLERNVYAIEDEFHFFMLCPMYEELRNMYFYPSWRRNITVHLFYNIMKSQNDQAIIAVSKFLVSAFSFRNLYYPN